MVCNGLEWQVPLSPSSSGRPSPSAGAGAIALLCLYYARLRVGRTRFSRGSIDPLSHGDRKSFQEPLSENRNVT